MQQQEKKSSSVKAFVICFHTFTSLNKQFGNKQNDIAVKLAIMAPSQES
jgi:hypothetical protein